MELSWICPALSLAHDLTLGIGLEAARKGSGGLRTVGNERSGVDPATFLRLNSGAERPLRGAFIKPPAMRVVVDLFLVRAESRQRELALRTALGATRGDLVRFFLSEATALAVLGGVVGTGLAAAALRGLVALSPDNIPRLSEVGLDPTGASLYRLRVAGLGPSLRAHSRDSLPAAEHRQRHQRGKSLCVGGS